MTDTGGTSAARPRPAALSEFTEWAGERYGNLPALRSKGAGPVSYDRLRDRVRDIGRGLMAAGVAPGDRVAVLGETCADWTYAHFAVLAVGAVVVPVYPTAGDDELAWVLTDSGATLVLCENAEQAKRVSSATPSGPFPALLFGELAGLDAGAVAVDDFLARAAAVRPQDLASLVYTSGTTGPPKGCRLTHANFGAVLDGGAEMIRGGPGDVTYLYLPLAHLLAQLIELNTLMFGGELCYFGGRIEDVVGELAEVRPTHLPSVPRLFEKVHAVVLGLAEAQEGGRERFAEAVRVGVLAAEGRLPEEDRATWEAAEESLYGLVRAAFGGRLRWALTGAAPIAPQTLDFLRACGIPVYEGYGMTESGGVISLNRPGAVKYGSVGRAYPGCEMRIDPQDGEVLARGGMVFPGYHGNDTATREALDADGWLHTGDLGMIDEDGYLTITGRKKDLVITSSGKNLTPSAIEHAIQQSRYVSYAVMAGDRRPHPVALITLEGEEIAAWAAREGHDLGPRPGRHPAVRELVREAVEAANAQVSRPARIRAFAVLDQDLGIADGTLTPTLKVRRKAVLERYAAEIEALYR
ncbi:putative long-chain-fatty-acid--CoA ligase FadD [Streptomyces spiroverticillatus]|uniref:Acyl-CoA synthetase n=1 Tax=Streptomyces finlayi TaxID=67296 RepID=A0A918WT66_9ACTN|nr:AMP-dependent synthetase/ligase [Streptomyces finlayi]GGZ89658.1 putative long-chain-fatty-acid--CoA ligase FadD [Streptomyces spiroverticillatus]GHC80507.1 putative long-chain-fatty-acid--CoA ligase FadD [Streptomyces finlayi]